MRRGVQDGAFKDATQVRVTAPPFEETSKDSPLQTESPLRCDRWSRTAPMIYVIMILTKFTIYA